MSDVLIVGETGRNQEILSPVPIIDNYSKYYCDLRKGFINAAIRVIREEAKELRSPIASEEDILARMMERVKENISLMQQPNRAEVLGLDENQMGEFEEQAHKRFNKSQPMSIMVLMLPGLLRLPEEYSPVRIETGKFSLDIDPDWINQVSDKCFEEIKVAVRDDPLKIMYDIVEGKGYIFRLGLASDSDLARTVDRFSGKLQLPPDGDKIQDSLGNNAFTVKEFARKTPYVVLHGGEQLGSFVHSQNRKFLVDKDGTVLFLPEYEAVKLISLFKEAGTIDESQVLNRDSGAREKNSRTI